MTRGQALDNPCPEQAGPRGTLAALDEARRLARAVVDAWPRQAGCPEAGADAVGALDAWLDTQERPHA